MEFTLTQIILKSESMTLVQGLLIVVGSLAGTVGVLFFAMRKSDKRVFELSQGQWAQTMKQNKKSTKAMNEMANSLKDMSRSNDALNLTLSSIVNNSVTRKRS